MWFPAITVVVKMLSVFTAWQQPGGGGSGYLAPSIGLSIMFGAGVINGPQVLIRLGVLPSGALR